MTKYKGFHALDRGDESGDEGGLALLQIARIATTRMLGWIPRRKPNDTFICGIMEEESDVPASQEHGQRRANRAGPRATATRVCLGETQAVCEAP